MPSPAETTPVAAATPGPWRDPYLDTLPNGLQAWRVDSSQPSGVSVVALLPTGANDPEIEAIQHANAALLAAAPELRDLLVECLDTLRDILDKGALKNVEHLADNGDWLRLECHARVLEARTLLARLGVTL